MTRSVLDIQTVDQTTLRVGEEVWRSLTEEMTKEQLKWLAALSEPKLDTSNIERGLFEALEMRSLKGWSLRQYQTCEELLGRYRFDSSSSHSWCVTGRFYDVTKEWVKKDREAALRSWNIKSWSHHPTQLKGNMISDLFSRALRFYYCARRGFGGFPCLPPPKPELLTHGIRDAFSAGLEIVLPLEETVLGWVAL